ncbi:MAG: 23S rRNA (guanosine(2251)-2'-O)-methyltransferase RlmB [Vampirovibrionales bacterium]|nr:23S rRNA (guanosine(2251)-2'-O)-methyltransferase RlmB [Vampirovibrionales bacterium]
MSSSYVFGKNSVRVLLESNPKRVQRIYFSDSLRPDKRVDEIYALAKANGLNIQKVGRAKLDQMLSQAVELPEGEAVQPQHQGVVALVAAKAFLSMSEVLKIAEAKITDGERPLVLALDSVSDPRNLGAILRVADGAGVLAVIMPKNNSAALGPAAAKTASGAEESVDVCLVPNLVQALEALKKSGFWVVGSTGQARLDINKKDKNDKALQPYNRLKYDMATVLVMGSEGEGMRSLVEKTCDFLAEIPMRGVVDSLNVAVATGILAFHIRGEQLAK